MTKKTRRAFLKSLSSVIGNLSATWFALAFIVPNFSPLFTIDSAITLTKDISLGIVFLLVTTLIERLL